MRPAKIPSEVVERTMWERRKALIGRNMVALLTIWKIKGIIRPFHKSVDFYRMKNGH